MKTKKKKEDDKPAEEGEEVKEANPDVLEGAFDTSDHAVPVEGVEEDDQISGVGGGDAEEDDMMIDSGDFRVSNEW